MIPFELHVNMCFYVMHTWLLPLQNNLWKYLLKYNIKIYDVWCQLLFTFSIWFIIYNWIMITIMLFWLHIYTMWQNYTC